MDRVSDEELVRRVLSGDRDAFGALVERYKGMVYGVAYAHLRNFHDAQDLSQEVFIKAFLNLSSYDPARPFGNWLYVITRRMAIDRLRGRREMKELTDEIIDRSPTPDVRAERREMQRLLKDALSRLSERNRETFCLYYMDGYSIREISRILSVPQGTVKRRLHEARKILRKEVVRMAREGFKEEALTWKFTEDVVGKVSDLKTALLNLLPEEFRELASLSDEELRERRNELLRSLADTLSIDLEELKLGEELSISVSDLTEDRREYLWKTLHELELMEVLSMLRGGTIFTPLIKDFHSVEVKLGLYKAPGWKEIHNRPYIRFVRPNPDGSEHSIQLGPIS
jgi:RNA polymerase sigma-70 factor (ECF subfamily)